MDLKKNSFSYKVAKESLILGQIQHKLLTFSRLETLQVPTSCSKREEDALQFSTKHAE